MTSKEQSRANTRAALEETAKHFGISVEQAAKGIVEGLGLKAARAAGVPDWAIDMANAVPTDMIRDIVHDNRAPTGPSAQGIIPSSQQMSNVRAGGNGTGWQNPIPLSNPPGTNWVDALCIADDQRQRAERKRGGG
jgi:hypothetical protein